MTTGAVLWVMKFNKFGGSNSLLHEAVATEIMTHMGLPVPRWSPIVVTDEFIDHYPNTWFQGADGTSSRPDSGLHFGSRLTLSPEGFPTYQVIPKSWHDRIVNREDFIGALAADLWTNNCDRRQCLFLCTGPRLYVRFIDHDHCFGGFRGEGVTCPRLIMMPSPQLFEDALNESVISRWKKVIDRISEATLDRIFERIPPAWGDATAISQILAQLATRRNRLESLLTESVAYLRDSGVGVDTSARSALDTRVSYSPNARLCQ
jgi:hypothetical protein